MSRSVLDIILITKAIQKKPLRFLNDTSFNKHMEGGCYLKCHSKKVKRAGRYSGYYEYHSGPRSYSASRFMVALLLSAPPLFEWLYRNLLPKNMA